jgi:outer membrane protein assembly factor BamB
MTRKKMKGIKKGQDRFWFKKGAFLLVVFGLVCFWLILGSRSKKQAESWHFGSDQAITSEFSFDEKNIYFGDQRGGVHALDKQTGVEVWRFYTHGAVWKEIETKTDSLVYVASHDGRIYALKKKTGEEVWRFVTPELTPSDTPAYFVSDLVYFGSRNGTLYALDPKTGEQRWQFKTRKVDNRFLTRGETIIHFGLLAFDKDNVYINSATDEAYYALNKKTGEEKWRFDLGSFLFKKPTVSKKTISFLSGDGFLYTLDKETGQERWRVYLGRGYKGEFAAHRGLFYYLDSQGLRVVDLLSGQQVWRYGRQGQERPAGFLQSRGRVFLSSVRSDGAGRLVALGGLSGVEIWHFDTLEKISASWLVDMNKVFVSGDDLYAFESQKGSRNWRFPTKEFLKDLIVTDDGLYLFSFWGSGQVVVRYLERRTGQEKWFFETEEVSLSVRGESGGNLYLLAKDKKGVFALLKEGNLEKLRKGRFGAEKSIWWEKTKAWVGQLLGGFKVDLVPSPEQIGRGEICEISFKHKDGFYKNPWQEVDLWAEFKSEAGSTFRVRGFYWDKDTWKIRFAPQASGRWRWKAEFRGPVVKKKRRGSFEVVGSDELGFLKISKSSQEWPSQLVFDNGQPFWAIGIQDCLRDENHNGDPLDQWGIGIGRMPSDEKRLRRFSLGKYLKTYGPQGAGFNLFHWGVDNCSFRLWQEISPNGNSYGLNEGLWGDRLVRALRKSGFRILMTVFGFEPPFSDSIDQESHRRAIFDYLDYVVARFGAYVDIWGLTNEAKVGDEWISLAAQYLKKVDPYRHPIATNWEKPHLDSIDINSPHWYEKENELFSDLITANKITQAQRWGKPVVFSEQGNLKSNWDPFSGLRMRLRSWAAFFKGATLIFWNSSGGPYQPPRGTPANIYLGPEERTYVRVLTDFFKGVGPARVKKEIVHSHPWVRAYGFQSEEYFLGYFHHFRDRLVSTRIDFPLSLPSEGVLEWVKPESGTVIKRQAVKKGQQQLFSPPFKVDLALKIKFSS